MKRMTKQGLSLITILAALVSILLLLAWPTVASADTASESGGNSSTQASVLSLENNSMSSSTTDVLKPAVPSTMAGSVVNISSGNETDIQAALNKNLTSSSTRLTVNVTKSVTLSRPLYIYSNTTLQLGNGVVIKRGSNFDAKFSAMLYGGGITSVGKYDKFKDVTITGGTWDGGSFNKVSVQILSLRHGQNITVSKTTLRNATYHMINVAASKAVNIQGVTFKNAIKYDTKTNNNGFWGSSLPANQAAIDDRYMGIEAIHTDVDTEIGEPGDSPHDGIPAIEVIVNGCTFDNVLVCAGTHHTAEKHNAGKKSGQPNVTVYKDRTYLTFTNNTINNVEYRAVNVYSMHNVKIAGNTISGTPPRHFAYIRDSQGLTISGNAGAMVIEEGSSATLTALLITKSTLSDHAEVKNTLSIKESSVVIFNSTIEGAKENGIYLDNVPSATISGNTIENAGKKGIHVSGSSGVTITKNTIRNSKGYGILVGYGASKNVTIDNNQILESVENGISVAASGVTIINNVSVSNKNTSGKREIYVDATSSGSVKDNLYGPRGMSVKGTVTTSPKVWNGNKPYVKNNTVWSRIAGTNAVATNQASTKKWGAKSTYAVITADRKPDGSSSYGYNDALAAASLAGALNAPILMTYPTQLAGPTKVELNRLGVTTVYIVGSTKEVEKGVEEAIRKDCPKIKTIKRIGDATVSARAVSVAKETAKIMGSKKPDTVIIAMQQSYRDALSISSYAYASKTPILYLEVGRSLSSTTLSYIKSAGYKKAIIIGGPLAIPESVDTQLKGIGISAGNITRIAGANAYNTSYIIAKWSTGELKNGKGAGFYKYSNINFQPAVKMGYDKIGIVQAQGWRDGISATALCGKNKSVILAVDHESTNNLDLTRNKKAIIKEGYVFGGELAVTKAVYNCIENSTN